MPRASVYVVGFLAFLVGVAAIRPAAAQDEETSDQLTVEARDYGAVIRGPGYHGRATAMPSSSADGNYDAPANAEGQAMMKPIELPAEFRERQTVLPTAYGHVVSLGLLRLDPWTFLQPEEGDRLRIGLRTRYPDRLLAPFARRIDSDDVACFVPADGAGSHEARVAVIHDFASAGWEGGKKNEEFWSWFKAAIEDMIERFELCRPGD